MKYAPAPSLNTGTHTWLSVAFTNAQPLGRPEALGGRGGNGRLGRVSSGYFFGHIFISSIALLWAVMIACASSRTSGSEPCIVTSRAISMAP